MGAGASGPSRTINVQAATSHPKGTSPSLSPSHNTTTGPACSPTGLSTPNSQLQQNTPAAGSSLSGGDWAWEYEEFPGGPFKPFDAQTSRQLEDAFEQRIEEEQGNPVNHVSILLGGRVLHTVNVVALRAVGPGGAARPVQRVSTAASAATVLFASGGKAKPRGSIATELARSAHDPLEGPSAAAAAGSVSPSNEIDAFSSTTSDPPPSSDPSFAPTLHSIIKAHQTAVYGITFGIEGNRIVTGAKDGSCKHWEVDTSFLITEFEKHPGSVLSTAMSPNGSLIATGCDDDKARLFSPKEKQPRAVLEGHQHKVYCLAFTSDGKNLVTTSMDDTLKMWDVVSYQAIRNVVAHRSSIFSLQTSCQTPHLGITAGDDSLLISHDFRLNNTVTARYIGHESTLWGCDIRFDDEQFISCGMDARVCLWDPRNPSAPVNVVRSHKNPVHCVEYMPDGRTFLSSARDRSFRLTVANSGKEVFRCVAHHDNVYRVTYNAATSRIMTCGSDALVKLWTLPPVILNVDD